jgi:hypothetical protein
LVALFLLAVSTAAATAQGLIPSVWQGQQGALLKVLGGGGPPGSFTGVFISNPMLPCPAVPYTLAGQARGARVVFQTSRQWTPDCRVTAVWQGRLVNPTTLVTRWVATSAGPTGRPIRTRGTEVFRRF